MLIAPLENPLSGVRCRRRRAAAERGAVGSLVRARGEAGPVSPEALPGLCASEGGATAAEVAAPFRSSLAALLTGHILRDGEVVMLILKPSMWFIVFSSLRFLAAGLIVLIAVRLGWVRDARVVNSVAYAVTFIVAGRVMWAVLQWMGRLYVLTDLRVVRLSGVFNVEILDCALRKVGQTRITRTFREKLWRLGSIEIVPVDDSCPPSVWQTVSRPEEVREKIQSTIDRAKQGGVVCAAE